MNQECIPCLLWLNTAQLCPTLPFTGFAPGILMVLPCRWPSVKTLRQRPAKTLRQRPGFMVQGYCHSVKSECWTSVHYLPVMRTTLEGLLVQRHQAIKCRSMWRAIITTVAKEASDTDNRENLLFFLLLCKPPCRNKSTRGHIYVPHGAKLYKQTNKQAKQMPLFCFE